MSKNSLATPGYASIPWMTLGVLGILVLGLALLASLLVSGNRAARVTSADSTLLSSDQRMIRIADQLQCPICEGQSVAFSNSQLAAEMRRTIEDKLRAGESEDEIIQYFVDRYGVKILREPPRQGLIAWLWITPVAGFVLALLALVWKLRQMSGQRPSDEPNAETAASPEGAAVLDPALQELVAQYDKELLS